MKRIKMGLMALAALTGLGSAFAKNVHSKAKLGTTYYARSIGSGQAVWTRVQPDGDCAAGSPLVCTITSTSANVTNLAPNTFPDQFTEHAAENTSYQP